MFHIYISSIYSHIEMSYWYEVRASLLENEINVIDFIKKKLIVQEMRSVCNSICKRKVKWHIDARAKFGNNLGNGNSPLVLKSVIVKISFNVMLNLSTENCCRHQDV